MGEFLDFIKSKKNLSSVLILGILILALAIIVNIRQQQIIKSRAAEDPLVFTGSNVSQREGKWVSTSTVVPLKLTSPLGPPRSTASSQLSLNNPSFEQNKEGWGLWDPSEGVWDIDTDNHGGSRSSKFQLGTKEAFGGRVACITQGAAQGVTQFSQPSLWQAKTLRVSFWYKSKSGVNVSSKINITDSDNNRNAYWAPGVFDAPYSATWVQGQKDTTIPPTINGKSINKLDFDICFGTATNGPTGADAQAWVDDVKIEILP